MIRKQVVFFSNGTTMFFDGHGQQVPELQEAWLGLALRYLQQQGVDITNLAVEMPGGHIARPFFTTGGHLNWEYEKL